jgi:hypothetical protein
MSFLFHLKALLGSKLAALAAGALLVGSAAAVAGPGPTVLEVRPASESDLAVVQDDAEGAAQDPARAEVGDEAEEASTELELVDGGGENDDSDVEREGPQVDEREAPEVVKRPAAAGDGAERGDDERSEVAKAVHRAKAGELTPGDPGFGAAVSESARENRGNGRVVSEAARTANGSIERGASSHGPDGAGERGPGERGPRDREAGDGPPFGRGPDDTGPPGHSRAPKGS